MRSARIAIAQHTACMRYAHGRRRNWGQQGGMKDEVALLVETLSLGSVGLNTQKNYLAKWNTWVKERKAQGKGPRLNAINDPDEV